MSEPPLRAISARARGSRRGPAPELVEAGYELELADAPLLHRGFGLADLAHAIALGERGVIPADRRAALLGALLDLLDDDARSTPRYGDLANARERRSSSGSAARPAG